MVTSLIRKRRHPKNHHRALGILLLKGPKRELFLCCNSLAIEVFRDAGMQD
jgi:hypothetical protein